MLTEAEAIAGIANAAAAARTTVRIAFIFVLEPMSVLLLNAKSWRS
jgi:hypothetical protein